YLPVAFILPVSQQMATAPREPFVDLLQPFFWPYLCFMAITNVIVAVGLWRLQRLTDRPHLVEFYGALAWILVSITAFNLFALIWAIRVWPDASRWFLMGVALSPVLPTLLFAYFVLR